MLVDFLKEQIFLVIVFIGSFAAFVYLTLQKLSGIVEVSPAEATNLINRQDAVIIDVRSFDEFVKGHLPNAKNFPAETFLQDVDKIRELQKDKPLLLYCTSGLRSQRAAKELKNLGFTLLHNLADGINAWINANYPIIKGKK